MGLRHRRGLISAFGLRDISERTIRKVVVLVGSDGSESGRYEGNNHRWVSRSRFGLVGFESAGIGVFSQIIGREGAELGLY